MAHPHPLTRGLTWEEAFEGELEGGAWRGELEAVTSQNGRQSHSSHTLTHSFCPTLSLSPHAFTLLSAHSSYSFSFILAPFPQSPSLFILSPSLLHHGFIHTQPLSRTLPHPLYLHSPPLIQSLSRSLSLSIALPHSSSLQHSASPSHSLVLYRSLNHSLSSSASFPFSLSLCHSSHLSPCPHPRLTALNDCAHYTPGWWFGLSGLATGGRRGREPHGSSQLLPSCPSLPSGGMRECPLAAQVGSPLPVPAGGCGEGSLQAELKVGEAQAQAEASDVEAGEVATTEGAM